MAVWGQNVPLFGAVMTGDLSESFGVGQTSKTLLEQSVLGSRRLSTLIVGLMVSIGGIGFLLAAFSSYYGKDFLPLGNPSQLIFVPQGLVMGLYGIVAFVLAIYLWLLIAINFGGGGNRFDKSSGFLKVTRRGLFKMVTLDIPLKDVKAVRVEVRDGINPRRRISLRLKSRADLPLTSVGQPLPLARLEQEAAELARFLEVNLEGL